MRIERWAGRHTFRAQVGPLWFGANLRTLGFFVLIEGGPEFLSWNPTEKLMIRALGLAVIIAAIVYIW